MKKRGLSAVVTTLIIILLVLVAIGVVWVVISNLITEGAEQVSLGKFTINMEIKNVEVKSDGTVDVKVKRNPGKGELSGIKFLVSDGVEVQEFEETTTMGELGQKTFTLNYDGLVKDISIAPILESESGKEFVGNEIDKEVFNSIGLNDLIDYGLISWWKLDGDALDEFGSNDGTISGANCNANGKFGNGCSFDATDDLFDTNLNTNNLNTPTTFSLWFNTGQDIRQTLISGYNNGGEPNRWDLEYRPGQKIAWYEHGGGISIYSQQLVSINEWNHILAVHDSTNNIFRLYLNGRFDSEGAISLPLTSNIDLGIGRRVYAVQFTFDGIIDEPMIFNRALSEDEAKALYELDLG